MMKAISESKHKLYKLGLYEKAKAPNLSWKDKFDICLKSGFDFMELSLDESIEKKNRLKWNKSQKKDFLDAQKEVGISVPSINISTFKNLVFVDEKQVFVDAVNLFKEIVDFAYSLNISNIQITSFPFSGKLSVGERENIFVDFLKEITDYICGRNMYISFETQDNGLITNTVSSMKIIEKVNSPWLRYYPDLGNLINFGNLKEKYNGKNDAVENDLKVAKGIRFCHIKETNENHDRRIEFGSGNDHAQYVRHFQLLKELGCEYFVAEFWYKENCGYKRIEDVASFLRKRLDEVFI